MKKYREFWVDEERKQLKTCEKLVHSVRLTNPHHSEFDGRDAIHLIEHAAITELESQLRVAVECIEFYAGEKDDSLDWHLVNNFAAIQDRGKLARETLKKLRGEG